MSQLLDNPSAVRVQQPVGIQRRTLYILLAVSFAIFYWKILFTTQFSVVEDWEAANQGLAWEQFAVNQVHQGILPLWDPYTFSGRSFIGEMQPGVFYPLKALLYLSPLHESRFLSLRVYEYYFVFEHLLGAVFMILLAYEAGIRNRFAALIAGICFALGGFTGNSGGPHMWDSAIWLPLILFFTIRAVRQVKRKQSLLYGALAGLSLAMPVLAGGLHVAIMDTLAVLSATAFLCWPEPAENGPAPAARLQRGTAIVVVIGAIAFLAAAVQLLPSWEYAPFAYRWGAGGTPLEKVPYSVLSQTYLLPPHSIFAFLSPEAPYSPGEYAPYFGILPLLLAIIGAWQCRHVRFVRYLAALGVLAFIYTLGSFSLLHGLLYVVPFLDKAREAGRFIYLTHFAGALLAGFGVQALLETGSSMAIRLRGFMRGLGIFTALAFIGLLIPSIIGSPSINEWNFVCLLFLGASYGILRYSLEGGTPSAVRFLILALILWDLNAFNWVVQNRMDRAKNGTDNLEQLLAARPLADFLQSQPGPFRVQVEASPPVFVNLGDMFGVEITGGQAATTPSDYLKVWGESPKGSCLTNIRYHVVADHERSDPLLFTFGRWRIYQDPAPCPRAWVVHQATVVPSAEETQQRMKDEHFDPLQSAFVREPLEAALGRAPSSAEKVTYSLWKPNRLEADVTVSQTGMAVLSEMEYPGWVATVNGKPVPIHRVDSLVRGVVVQPGQNHISMRYAPRSVLYGALLSGATWLSVLLIAGWVFVVGRKSQVS